MKRFTLALACVAMLGGVSAAAENHVASVIVEPDLLVTRDIDASHTETFLAVDPNNSEHLLGAVTTFARMGDGLYDIPQASLDGGYTWSDAAPAAIRDGSGDPQTNYGVTGTAYFATLSDKYKGMVFFRSTDGGLTWSKPLVLGAVDHEQIAVDRTGNHRGRIYITGEAPVPNSKRLEGDRYLELWRSDDDGRSFTHKSIATGHTSPDAVYVDGGVAAEGLAVLSDGTLVVGIVRYVTTGSYPAERMYTMTSMDGGNSFSPEHRVTDNYFGSRNAMQVLHIAASQGDMTANFSISELAADTWPGSPFSGRLYVVWNDVRSGHPSLFYKYSADRGMTWSQPQRITAGPLEKVSADFQPAIATSDRGVVGILFYHAPVDGSDKRFDAFFTASDDGGQTLSPPVRVSSQSSQPAGIGNMLPMALPGDHSNTDIEEYFISGLSRWPDGGDYIGLAADSNGVFHALWPDSRSGTYQLYTARIDVDAPVPPAPADAKAESLDAKVALVFDPTHYDAATRDYIFPIRLRNISNGTIYGPVTVTLKTTVDKYMIAEHRPPTPYSILNADNGKRGQGALFDYTAALGGMQQLPPHGISAAVNWRVHLGDPADAEDFQMHLDVIGRYAGHS